MTSPIYVLCAITAFLGVYLPWRLARRQHARHHQRMAVLHAEYIVLQALSRAVERTRNPRRAYRLMRRWRLL